MGEMPENIDGWVLRADQKYLYDMVRSVDSGVCDSHLGSIKPGPLNLSRWLTTASRILRLYVTKPTASEELKKLAIFIMKIYAPFWFLVKRQPQAVMGSRHLFTYIRWTQKMPQDVQRVIHRSIQINGFYAHPENILLSMITDENKDIRSEGYTRILHSRNNADQGTRKFVVPKLLFDCESYTNMISWDDVGPLTEPPCIQFYSQDYLMQCYNSENVIEIPGKL